MWAFEVIGTKGPSRSKALAVEIAALGASFDLMILEHAVLDVVAGESERFEEAFRSARPIISSMPGCRSVRLERCIESPSRYLLLVEWVRLEDHTVGFRGSEEYQEWRRLLHHFYDPLPAVEHYELVGTS